MKKNKEGLKGELKFVRLNICSESKSKTIRLKFQQKQKNKQCCRTEHLKLGTVVKFEHIKARREPNGSVNFVCMAIEIACTLESNLLPTTIQTQSN